MDIQGVKDWIDDFIEILESSPPDIQQKIIDNRKRWGLPFRKKEEVKEWVVANKPIALPYLVELKTWLEDLMDYFKEGFCPESGETIDTLRDKILERLKFIRTKLDSL